MAGNDDEEELKTKLQGPGSDPQLKEAIPASTDTKDDKWAEISLATVSNWALGCQKTGSGSSQCPFRPAALPAATANSRRTTFSGTGEASAPSHM